MHDAHHNHHRDEIWNVGDHLNGFAVSTVGNIVQADGQDDGEGKAGQHAEQTQQHGVLNQLGKHRRREELLKVFQADPLTASDAFDRRKAPEGDLRAVHRLVFENKYVNYGQNQH